MHAARQRFGTAARADVINAARAAHCNCVRHSGGVGIGVPGGASCPKWVPADLVHALQQNLMAVEAISLFCAAVSEVLVTSVFLAPAAPPLLAVSVVLTSLSNNCDLGASLASTARQAALGCKIGATAATAVGLLPIALILGPLGNVLDALGNGKAPKMADVANFGQAAGQAGNVNAVDIGGKLATGAPSVVNDKTLQGLVGTVGKVAASTTNDAENAFYEGARGAIIQAIATQTPIDQALQGYAQKQPAVGQGATMIVSQFIGAWRKAGSPMNDQNAVANLWDSIEPNAPFTPKERQDVALDEAKNRAHKNTAHDNALAVAKQRAHENTAKWHGSVETKPVSKQQQLGGRVIPIGGSMGAGSGISHGAPPSAPPLKVKKPLSTKAKVAVGAGVITLIGIAVKVAIA
jgi:hypothetical protein